VSRIELRRGDIALLERLNQAPLEIGELSSDSVARLMASGLVTKVLGCCEITRKGQLTVHRQHFLKASRRRIARVTRRNPMFLQEAILSSSLSRTRLTEHLNIRRRFDAGFRQATKMPRWLARLASEIAGRFRTIHETPSEITGLTDPKLKPEPR
jgi:hypothetical protein